MRYFSMFSGIGGFELGIQQANNRYSPDRSKEIQGNESNDTSKSSGFVCIGFSEIDKYAVQTYLKHYPNHKNFGDAAKINTEELPDFDLLCGGFPCQAFSIAGKRRGFDDTRGTLFFEIARILEAKRPSFILLENVKGLLNHNKGQTFRTIIQALSELGYDIQWMVLNSKFHGVPQNRERVFIIGSLRGECRPEILPLRGNYEEANGIHGNEEQKANAINATYARNQSDGQYVREKIVGGAQGMRVYDTNGVSTTIAGDAGGLGGKTGLYCIPVLTPDRLEKRQNGRRFKEDGDPSFTLTGQDIHGISTGTQIRRLTPTECERLQGFPDGWTAGVSDTQRYKQLGNAVTVNVIRAIMERFIS